MKLDIYRKFLTKMKHRFSKKKSHWTAKKFWHWKMDIISGKNKYYPKHLIKNVMTCDIPRKEDGSLGDKIK